MAPHGCVTLKVGGEERSFAIEDGATASVLFDAMGGELAEAPRPLEPQPP